MSAIAALPNLRPLDSASVAPAGFAAPGQGPGPAQVEPSPPDVSALPNPSLRLDAGLGLVVLEFRDAGGEPRTIPSKRELDAYRSAARGQPGQAGASPAFPATGSGDAGGPAPQNTPASGTPPARAAAASRPQPGG